MRTWLKKWLPNPESLHKDKNSRWLVTWLNKHTYLWHINRQTIARGVAAGLLFAFVPLPIQMPAAALLALWFRGNLPIAIVTTWISNPITFVPISYLIYKTGTFVTQSNGIDSVAKMPAISVDWGSLTGFLQSIWNWVSALGPPYFIGLIVFSICAALLGYCLSYAVWNIYIRLKWLSRKRRGIKIK